MLRHELLEPLCYANCSWLGCPPTLPYPCFPLPVQDDMTRASRVEAVHVAIALHQEGLLGKPGGEEGRGSAGGWPGSLRSRSSSSVFLFFTHPLSPPCLPPTFPPLTIPLACPPAPCSVSLPLCILPLLCPSCSPESPLRSLITPHCQCALLPAQT